MLNPQDESVKDIRTTYSVLSPGGSVLNQHALEVRFAAGEHTAMRELYQEHAGLVFSLCMSALRHRQDAEDATQQVFTRAWRSRETYDASRPPGAWLVGITRRVISDTFASQSRERRNNQAWVSNVERDPAEQVTEALVDRVVVQQTMEDLEPPKDEILRLAYTEDLPL